MLVHQEITVLRHPSVYLYQIQYPAYLHILIFEKQQQLQILSVIVTFLLGRYRSPAHDSFHSAVQIDVYKRQVVPPPSTLKIQGRFPPWIYHHILQVLCLLYTSRCV